MTNGYDIEDREDHEDLSKYLTIMYKNEVAYVAYTKMLHANIVFKRFLTAWTVVKHISPVEKETIQATVLAFRDEMKTRHAQIMSFIRPQIDTVSPKLTNMLLQVQTYAKKNVDLITIISKKFKNFKNFKKASSL